MSVRHPGPADWIGSLLEALSADFDVAVIATDSAARLLAQRFEAGTVATKITWFFPQQQVAKVPNAARIIGGFCKFQDRNLAGLIREHSDRPSSTELNPNNVSACRVLLVRTLAVLNDWRPNRCVRTTPAYGIGVDELLPTAAATAARSLPVAALQDYYGVGIALASGEHPVAATGVERVGCPDAAAVKVMRKRGFKKATALGWASHGQYLDGIPYDQARRNSRSQLGLGRGDRFVMYAGVDGGSAERADVLHFEQVVRIVNHTLDIGPRFYFSFRIHPRTSTEKRRKYFDLCRGTQMLPIDGINNFREILAAPDAIISAASAMNLDLLAYASTSASDSDDRGISIYTTDYHSRKLMERATGMPILPSHLPGMGSIVSNYEELARNLQAALFDKALRDRHIREANALFAPKATTHLRIAKWVRAQE